MEKIPRTFPVSFIDKHGKYHKADVETSDLIGRPDCRIGNFGENWWIRTKKALEKDFTGYKTLAQYKRAVRLSLTKRGCSNIVV